MDRETAHQAIKRAAAEYGWTIGNHPAAEASERDSHWVLRRAGRDLMVTFTEYRDDRRSSVTDAGTGNAWTAAHFGFKTGGGRLGKVLAYLATSDEDALRIATTPPVMEATR